ncbi:MAG: methylated-DNA--[protein]-cysteine S-methyltransferase [Phycisphaerae bacterium]|nr:methylated-DNA--[protein]-cysteine S-methyltransferase [Phycisphaerae bacterium]
MRKTAKYAIFPTKWGFFGIAGTEEGLLRTHLPIPEPEEIKSRLLQNLPAAQLGRAFFKQAQDRIAAYFAGVPVNFGTEIPLDLTELTPFQAAVLTACRRVKLGRTITYGQLAEELGKPNAARAVGNALAKNPLPLIIPCHRIVRSNNELGGFSAPGGTTLKARLLSHEHALTS